MLISPPFLPARGNDAEDAYLDRAMPTADHGAYPVSLDLSWHGGMHLSAPSDANNQPLPVRAIADGTVVYVRQPTARPADQTAREALPLGYNDWTDDGVVIVRHDTEIGADAQGAGTQVRFFSLYVHLNHIERAVSINQPIYRKAEIGRAGEFGGRANTLHFEIICDDANLKKLIGRDSGIVNAQANGRTDAVFGQMYFHLPATARVHATRPALNDPAPAGGSALGQALFVGIAYGGGHAQVGSYRPDGTTLGAALTENNAEYELYSAAGDIVRAYRTAGAAAVPAHSAVYELLRFGRVLGPDALHPADTAHWRQIRTPSGTGWVNLNATGVTKFSDADAPQWAGWQLRSAPDSVRDSRCRDLSVIWVLDTDHDNRFTEPEMRAALKDPAIRALYRRMVCKTHSEWERAGVAARWKWLKEPPSGAMPALRPNHMTHDEYAKFCAYAQALCFWEEANLGIQANHWHFHPREFIAHFRKCGWLSKDELARVYPDSKYPQQALAQEGRGRTPESIREEYRTSINKLLRKYCFTTPIRQAHFLGQGAVESFYLAAMLETSVAVSSAIKNNHISLQPEANGYLAITPANTPQTQYFNRYENMTTLGNDAPGDGIKFRGRGLKQLTGKYNYTEYWVYRGWLNRSSFDASWWNRQTSRKPIINNPEIVGQNSYNCIDIAGFFSAMNRILIAADGGVNANGANAVSKIINKYATNTFPARLSETEDVHKILNDKP